MTAIRAAIAHMNALKLREQFVYRKIADQCGVDRSTLSRRHKISGQHKLNPQ
ncbi:hypothetical protein BU25DRAFT_17710 [Macroventuria anomochaeta]|uniref:Uncharacterized protein n=1 Tax=Macroventuria anomochaeta TaxID=301207 RepID=A0ACB6S6J2_9PLEO|nr:uncharacterized protein BU25DRAFT_17710 [Macroventuria anomochaeta]KAF2629185.1 hypothetical protein BU25DRAFT_17710 [Macroventuria anomochaeta]